jgi:hypothetical protein
MDGTPMSRRRVAQALEVELTVAIREEACSAIVAPLNNVQRDPRKF